MVFLLFVGSATGLVISGQVFSSVDMMSVPTQSVAQSFVMYASILSVFYIAVFIKAVLLRHRLYDPCCEGPFKHQVYAWLLELMVLASVMWTAAMAVVGVCMYRDGGGESSAMLKADTFACGAGLFAMLGITSITLWDSRRALGPFRSPSIGSNGPKSLRSGKLSSSASIASGETHRISELERRRCPSIDGDTLSPSRETDPDDMLPPPAQAHLGNRPMQPQAPSQSREGRARPKLAVPVAEKPEPDSEAESVFSAVSPATQEDDSPRRTSSEPSHIRSKHRLKKMPGGFE